MWAAEQLELEAGKLPGVDSHEHQSALIHLRERALTGNCSFFFTASYVPFPDLQIPMP